MTGGKAGSMAWFRKKKTPKPVQFNKKSPVPEGLWRRCPGCKEAVYSQDVAANLEICPQCDHHFRIDARTRLRQLLDKDHSAVLLYSEIQSTDPLGFKDSQRYKDRLKASRSKAGKDDAVLVVEGTVAGFAVIIAAMEFRFMGGSMGSVVGEKLTRAIERAILEKRPVIIISASGGARMQEGVLSLMQMAKISSALHRLRAVKLPFISVLTDPTTGGVTASFAMLGDINIAEKGALIGFAGPRVIQQTIRQDLPVGFQRSEFLLEHGFLDLVVRRPDLKDALGRFLKHLT